MRRLFAACGLLLAILAGCLCNSWYMGRFTAGLVRALGQAQQAARAGDWTRAGETTLQAYESWESHRLYLHVVTRHGDADQILRAFRSPTDALSSAFPPCLKSSRANVFPRFFRSMSRLFR